MFNLKTASIEIRKCAGLKGIKSGTWEPRNTGKPVDALEDNEAVAVVSNRNYPDGIEITAGDIRYAGLYL